MIVSLFVTGIIIGVMASIPLGPIGVLCIQRTLSKNHRSGFISGLGAMVADMIYAMIAFFSLSIVVTFINENLNLVKLTGGVCVILVGLKILFSNPVVQIRKNRAGKSNLWQDFISVFLITIANPSYILPFIALFALFGISGGTVGGFASGMAVILGAAAGATSWWFLLTFVVNLARKRFRPRHMLWINRIAGSLIIALGAVTILLIFIKTPIDGVVQ